MTSYGIGDASYQAAGQLAGISQLIDDFYAIMATEDFAKDIHAMHKMDLSQMKERMIAFLSGWLGGPQLYTEKFGPMRLPLAHLPFDINEVDRDAWLSCMHIALEKQPYDDAFKTYLLTQLSRPAQRIMEVNQLHRA